MAFEPDLAVVPGYAASMISLNICFKICSALVFHHPLHSFIENTQGHVVLQSDLLSTAANLIPHKTIHDVVSPFAEVVDVFVEKSPRLLADAARDCDSGSAVVRDLGRVVLVVEEEREPLSQVADVFRQRQRRLHRGPHGLFIQLSNTELLKNAEGFCLGQRGPCRGPQLLWRRGSRGRWWTQSWS